MRISFTEAQILALDHAAGLALPARAGAAPATARCWARATCRSRACASALAAFIAAAARRPSLPPMPQVPLDSPTAFLMVLQQVLIGRDDGLCGAGGVRGGGVRRRTRSGCRWA
jgi:hypothetical protein